MRDTGKWVVVAENEEQERATTRPLYRDRRGRECVRYHREWRLVQRTCGPFGFRYIIGKLV